MNSFLCSLLRADLRAHFQPYSSAGSEAGKAEELAFLNANENPYPIAGLEGLNRYDVQQPPALIQKLAETYDVKPEYVLASRGSDESIDLLIRATCRPGADSIMICPPTFGMYGVYATLSAINVHQVPLTDAKGTWHLAVDEIIEAARKLKPKLLFLCSPNNPTGTDFPAQDLEHIVKSLSDVCAVVMDEAYIEFTDRESFSSKLSTYPNLIVLRTLSKAYALAGERLGCALSDDDDFMRFLRGCLAPYPMPKGVTQSALTALSISAQDLDGRLANLLEQTLRISKAFTGHPRVENVYPSAANFIFVRFQTGEDAKEFNQLCAQHHLILRDFSARPDTPGCLRISAGTQEEMDRLLEILHTFE